MQTASWRIVRVALVGSLQTLTAQPVITYGGNGALPQRWEWAVKEASNTGQKDFWIVYSIKRLMEEDSYIGTGLYFNGSIESTHSLYDLLENRGLDTAERRQTSRRRFRATVRTERSLEKELKDVAIIFKMSESGLRSIDVTNLELEFSFKQRPVYWLGSAELDESLTKLELLFPSLVELKQRQHCTQAMGLHQSDRRVPVLTKILESDEQPEIRAEAAEWLGDQNSDEILPLLRKTALSATTDRLLEACLHTISKVESEESTHLLIDFARRGASTRVRRKAAFWLGQRATAQSDSMMNDLIENDADTEVQRQALFAIGRSNDEQSILRLIHIAQTHQKTAIRKQAIYLLAEKADKDERALDALISFTKPR